MTRGRTKKSDILPKYGNIMRNYLLLNVTSLDEYQKTLEKGSPILFTATEMQNLKENYEDGITWDEVDKELSRKGIPLKKVTFRKYIQDGLLPKAKGYRNTDKGRVAIFPSDTIEHINFIHFFNNAAGRKEIEKILNLLLKVSVTYLEAVESREQWHRPIYASILHYICFGDGAVYEAIEEALSTRPEDRDEALKMLGEVDKTFHAAVDHKIEKLISFLKERRLLLPEVMTG